LTESLSLFRRLAFFYQAKDQIALLLFGSFSWLIGNHLASRTRGSQAIGTGV
jgi:hypothetical protein